MASYFIRNSTRAHRTVESSADRAAEANGATPRRYFMQQTMSLGESFDHHPEGSAQQLMPYYSMPETDPRHAKFHEHRLQVQLQNAIDAERRIKVEAQQQRRQSLGNYSRRSSLAVSPRGGGAEAEAPTVDTYVAVRFPQLAQAVASSSKKGDDGKVKLTHSNTEGGVARHEFTAKLPALSAHRRGGGGGAAASARQLQSAKHQHKDGHGVGGGALTGRPLDDDRATIKLLETYAVSPRDVRGVVEQSPTSMSTRLSAQVSTQILAPPRVPDDARHLLDASTRRGVGDSEAYITPAAANLFWEHTLRTGPHDSNPLARSTEHLHLDTMSDGLSDSKKGIDAALTPAPPVDAVSQRQMDAVMNSVRHAMLLHQPGTALDVTHHHQPDDEAALSASHKSVKFGQSPRFDDPLADTEQWVSRAPGMTGKATVDESEWLKRISALVATFQQKLRSQHDYFLALIHDKASHSAADARLVQISELSKRITRLEEENDELTQHALDLRAAKEAEAAKVQRLEATVRSLKPQLEAALSKLDDVARRRSEGVNAIAQTSLTMEAIAKLEDTTATLRSVGSLAGYGSMRGMPSPRKLVSELDFQPDVSISLSYHQDAATSPQIRPAMSVQSSANLLAAPTTTLAHAAVNTEELDYVDTAAQTDVAMTDFDSEPGTPTSISPKTAVTADGLSPQIVVLSRAPHLPMTPELPDSPNAPEHRRMTVAPLRATVHSPTLVVSPPAIAVEPVPIEADPYANDGVISLNIERDTVPDTTDEEDDDATSSATGSLAESSAKTPRTSGAARRKSSHTTTSSFETVIVAPAPPLTKPDLASLSTSGRDETPFSALRSPGDSQLPSAPRNSGGHKAASRLGKGVGGGGGLLVADVSPRNRSGSMMSQAVDSNRRRLSTMSAAPLARVASSLTQTTAAAANRESAIKIEETLSRLKRKTQATRTAVTRAQAGPLAPVAPPIGTIGFVAIAAFPEDTKTLNLLSTWMTDDILNGGAAWPVYFDGVTCIIAFANPAKALEFALDQLASSKFAFAVDVLSVENSHTVGPFACYDSPLARGMQNLVSFSAKGELIVPAPVYKSYVAPLKDVLVVMKVEATFHCTLDEVDLFSLHKEGAALAQRAVTAYDPLLPLSVGQQGASTANTSYATGGETPSATPLHAAASIGRYVRKRPPLTVRCTAPAFSMAHGSVASGNRSIALAASLYAERRPMLIVYSNEKHPTVQDTKEVASVGIMATVLVAETECGPDEQSLITHATQTTIAKKRNVACGFGEIELALAPLATSSMAVVSGAPRHEVEVDHGSDGESEEEERQESGRGSSRTPTPAIPIVLKKRQVLSEMFSCPCCATLFVEARIFIPCGHVFCNACIVDRMRFLPKDDYDVVEYRCKQCRHVSFDAPVPCLPIDVAVKELVQRGVIGDTAVTINISSM